MLRIRLSRRGKKKQPHYRVVVADIRFKRDGRFVENIGYYNPLTEPPTVEIKEDRALYWLSVGAQPSEPVRHFLQKQGTFDRLKRLHQGENLEELVAEFTGEEVKEEPKAAKTEESEADVEEESGVTAAVNTITEAVSENVEEAVATTEDLIEDAREAVEDAIETAAETVEEIVAGEDGEDENEEETSADKG